MTTQELRCPRTATPLARLQIAGVATDICEDCGGVWFDRLELSRFEGPESVYGEALVAHLGQFPVVLLNRSTRLHCPRHPEVVMLRRPFSSTASVDVDECPQCGGLWLDADELAQIRRKR